MQNGCQNLIGKEDKSSVFIVILRRAKKKLQFNIHFNLLLQWLIYFLFLFLCTFLLILFMQLEQSPSPSTRLQYCTSLIPFGNIFSLC